MSDTSQGPGWWQASDGRWYPPQHHPGFQVPAPPPFAPRGAYPPGSTLIAPPPTQGTNGMAVASLVLSILWIGGLGSLVAVIFAFVARRQIRDSRGVQGGDGLAIAGLVIGLVGVVSTVLIAIALAIAASSFNGLHLNLNGRTDVVHYGQTVTLPADELLAQPGLATITVGSLTIPAASRVPGVQPQSGTVFAVAQVKVCAGSGGLQNPMPDLATSFVLAFSGNQVVFPSADAERPGIDEISALGARRCSTGFITFQIAAGSTPRGVQYTSGFPLLTYQWSTPASSAD
jgi:Domain of unknown function (DUF4190)